MIALQATTLLHSGVEGACDRTTSHYKRMHSYIVAWRVHVIAVYVHFGVSFFAGKERHAVYMYTVVFQ